jgi:hypothetical protein
MTIVCITQAWIHRAWWLVKDWGGQARDFQALFLKRITAPE